MFPVTILDNFFENPHSVRQFALQQDFNVVRLHPGIRTKPLTEISPAFYDFFTQKLLSIFFDLKRDRVKFDIESGFQLSFSKYEEGWVHTDYDCSFAGVVYLNPHAPVDAGTSVYTRNNNTELNFDLRDKLYSGQDVDMNEYRIAREKHNSNFTKVLDVGNVYNRLFLYNGNQWHKENKLFGDDQENSRLTLVFFGNIMLENGQFPVERTRQS
jgi:hypothetical protein